MKSHVHAAILLPLLLGSLAGCEPAGPSEVSLSAPPNAVSPKTSMVDKVNRITYSAPDSAAALKFAADDLIQQGFDRCANSASLGWRPYSIERDGKRVGTMRYEEQLFRTVPPRLATIEMLRQADGVQVTVGVAPLLNGEVVVAHRNQYCGTSK